MHSDSDDSWSTILQGAISAGPRIIHTSAEFDRACVHIYGLLRDAAVVLQGRSQASSAFFSITALEEIAKVVVGMYRNGEDLVKRSKDPMYRHSSKHHIAATPTIPIGTRLTVALGEERVRDLIADARTGKLSLLREACIYFEAEGTKLNIPPERIDSSRAGELLLFALEAFEDALVGYTNESFAVGALADELFAAVERES